MRFELLIVLLPQIAFGSIAVLRSDARVFAFRYTPGPLRMEVDAAGRPQLEMSDADHPASAGEFDLPGKVILVGLPQTGSVRLVVNTGPEHVVAGEAAAVPRYSWEGESSWTAPPAGAATESWNAAELGEVEILRNVRCARVRLNPVRHVAAQKQLRWFEWIDVTLEFEQAAQPGQTENVFADLIAGMLANGAQARGWGVGSPARLRDPYERSESWVKVLVESTGVYRISGRELAGAGVPLSGLDPKTLAMFTVGEHEPCRSYPDSLRPVGIAVEDGEDGRFDPDDQIIFYGLAADHWIGRCSVWVRNLYTRQNVYWLTWGGMPGQRMARGLGYETTGTRIVRDGRDVLHQEPDLDCPARSGLLWVWTKIDKDAASPAASFAPVIEMASPIEVRRISGRLLSRTDYNGLSVSFNGRPVGTFQFRRALPSQPFDFRIDTVVPAAMSGNMVEIRLGGDGAKEAFLDFLEVEYRKRLSVAAGQLRFLHDDTGNFRFTVRDISGRAHVLDVTDPYRPKLAEGLEDYGDSIRFCRRLVRPAAFCVALDRQLMRPRSISLRTPGRIRSPLVQADYWVVAPEEFMPAARELARYRTGRVLGVPNAQARAVALEDLYDDYSFGMEEPWAVKQLFADKQAKFGLLVGDATYDYKGNLGEKASAGVPAFETGYGLDPDGTSDRSALAIDAWYADFEGDGGSPDMMLGRVTARTGQELRQFVDKLIAYESAPAGFWRRRLLLLADDEYLGDPFDPRKRDAIAFTHVEQCERMSALVGRSLDPVKVYLTEFPFVAIKSKPAANAELMRQLNLGGLLWLFFGHGSGFDLTHESVLNITRVPQIANAGRTPFCYFGSCSVGRFEDTRFESIAEELVRMKAGAIATVGATKSTASGTNEIFCRNMLTPLLAVPDSAITVGQGFYAGWPTDRSYHLFGDPATVLQLPKPAQSALTLRPDSLRPGSGFEGRGAVDLGRGRSAWTLFGPRRVRTYTSWFGTRSFVLPGVEVARGTGDIADGRFECRGVFPAGLALDTVFVADGNYAPEPASCRLSAVVWDDSTCLAAMADTVEFSRQPAASGDSAGPAVTFRHDGRTLVDGAVVPAEFELEVVLNDESGVLIAPVRSAEPQFFVNDRGSAEVISDRLVMDDGSFSTARFKTRLKLAGPEDSLFVIAADNLMNRTVAKVKVRPASADVLRVEMALVYPNPVRGRAFFSFVLSRAAVVRVRVYSLSGRLVRDMGDFPAGGGYNQIEWDGRDELGQLPANGVYLYTLRARCDEAPGRAQSVTVRDRLLIAR